MKLVLPLILSLVLPLFVAAFVPSRNNLHGLLSCENYDSSTIRVTLSSLDSSFEDGLYSITSSEFGFSNQAIIKIPANVSWMNNVLQYSPPSSIDPFFQNYVPLTFKCKLTERYLTSTKETAVLLRARIEGFSLDIIPINIAEEMFHPKVSRFLSDLKIYENNRNHSHRILGVRPSNIMYGRSSSSNFSPSTIFSSNQKMSRRKIWFVEYTVHQSGVDIGYDGMSSREKQLDEQENEKQWKATRFFSQFQRAKHVENPIWKSSFLKQFTTET